MPKPKVDRTCSDCSNIGRYSSYFHKYICEDCRETNNNYILISKSSSKKDYLLTDEDLQQIKVFEGKAKSTYGPATYYIKSDVINLACDKHMINLNNIDEEMSKIINDNNVIKEAKLEKRRERKEKRMEERKEELVGALRNAGVEFRNDSMLCDKYIDGCKDFSIDEIVERMSQMKYLYQYCHMEECKNIAYEKYLEDKNYDYHIDWSVTEHAEYLALKKYSNGKYPEVFPWQI